MNHPQLAKEFLSPNNSSKAAWHEKTLWKIRELRDKSISEVKEFEELRELASTIKKHTLENLDHYLIQFEKNAIKNGLKVHWAKNGQEHNEIIYGLLKEKKIKQAIKSKSMLTEECGLNKFLKHRDINIIDSDLGELIVQLKKQPPSHIVIPAIHLNKKEIGKIFLNKSLIDNYSDDPQLLTFKARQYLRRKFLTNRAAITGVNFAIAETGGVVIVTNEGNADLAMNLSEIQIHCLGIEKIIPRYQDLGIFTRLLARSATGQPISVYTSHYHKPRSNNTRHIIILDNLRSDKIGNKKFYQSLKCIRCGACLNTCPVYRRSGGYSYRYTIPGPIGSILAPSINMQKFKDLPFASSLCGSCTYVCPVKVNIHEQLFYWRQEISKKKKNKFIKKIFIYFLKHLLINSKFYDFFLKGFKFLAIITPSFLLKKSNWGKYRNLPPLHQESFKSWYKKNYKN